MEKWNRFGKTVALTSRLADMILRVQRIALAQRINQLEAMVQIHAPDLLQQPGGAARLDAVKKAFAEAKRDLRRKRHGK